MQGQIAIGAISNGFLLRPYFGDWNAAYNFSRWNCFITFTPDSWIFATAFSRTVKKKVCKSIAIETRAYTCSKVIALFALSHDTPFKRLSPNVFTPALKHSRCLRETRLHIYMYTHTKRLKCNRLPLPLPFRVFASNNKYQDRYFLPRKFMKTLAREYFARIADTKDRFEIRRSAKRGKGEERDIRMWDDGWRM